MKYKANFKILMLIHLVGIIVLGCLFSIIGAAHAGILNWVIGALFFSMVVQLLVYAFKPGWFNDKVRDQPGTP